MSHTIPERRKRERVTLRCPVLILPTDGHEGLQAFTLNVSSHGVYCLTERSFAPGARFECRIEITPEVVRPHRAQVWLECEVEVVRVEKRPDGFGVGCRIESYVLRRPKPIEQPREEFVEAPA